MVDFGGVLAFFEEGGSNQSMNVAFFVFAVPVPQHDVKVKTTVPVAISLGDLDPLRLFVSYPAPVRNLVVGEVRFWDRAPLFRHAG